MRRRTRRGWQAAGIVLALFLAAPAQATVPISSAPDIALVADRVGAMIANVTDGGAPRDEALPRSPASSTPDLM